MKNKLFQIILFTFAFFFVSSFHSILFLVLNIWSIDTLLRYHRKYLKHFKIERKMPATRQHFNFNCYKHLQLAVPESFLSLISFWLVKTFCRIWSDLFLNSSVLTAQFCIEVTHQSYQKKLSSNKEKVNETFFFAFAFSF